MALLPHWLVSVTISSIDFFAGDVADNEPGVNKGCSIQRSLQEMGWFHTSDTYIAFPKKSISKFLQRVHYQVYRLKYASMSCQEGTRGHVFQSAERTSDMVHHYSKTLCNIVRLKPMVGHFVMTECSGRLCSCCASFIAILSSSNGRNAPPVFAKPSNTGNAVFISSSIFWKKDMKILEK